VRVTVSLVAIVSDEIRTLFVEFVVETVASAIFVSPEVLKLACSIVPPAGVVSEPVENVATTPVAVTVAQGVPKLIAATSVSPAVSKTSFPLFPT